MSAREKSNSVEIAKPRRQTHSISYTKGAVLQTPAAVATTEQGQGRALFYQPTPAPQTVTVHSVPKKTNDACCWGCAAALCLCFGLEECCH